MQNHHLTDDLLAISAGLMQHLLKAYPPLPVSCRTLMSLSPEQRLVQHAQREVVYRLAETFHPQLLLQRETAP